MLDHNLDQRKVVVDRHKKERLVQGKKVVDHIHLVVVDHILLDRIEHLVEMDRSDHWEEKRKERVRVRRD